MSRVKDMFGKTIKELTKEEMRLYRKPYLPPRKTDPKELKSYKMFGKRRKDLTHEEKKALYRTEPHYVKQLKNSYKKSFCYQHFGKRWRELTPEEKKEFWKIQKAKCQSRKREQNDEK